MKLQLADVDIVKKSGGCSTFVPNLFIYNLLNCDLRRSNHIPLLEGVLQIGLTSSGDKGLGAPIKFHEANTLVFPMNKLRQGMSIFILRPVP